MPTLRNHRLARLTVTLSVALLSHLYTASASAAPLYDLTDKFNDMIEKLTDFTRPIFTLSLMLILLSFAGAPMFKRLAAENQELVMKVLFSGLLVGAVPDIVSFFMD